MGLLVSQKMGFLAWASKIWGRGLEISLQTTLGERG